LLWLWLRPAATAPVRPLAWEPPYTAGSRPRNGKKMKEKRKKERKKEKLTDLENTLVVAEGEREGVEWTGSLGLIDANYCIWSG